MDIPPGARPLWDYFPDGIPTQSGYDEWDTNNIVFELFYDIFYPSDIYPPADEVYPGLNSPWYESVVPPDVGFEDPIPPSDVGIDTEP